ncbi:hypothetical protein E1176_02650 [Fulvivirga sp. RKSG066]|uniref:tetratricopeptide repeat protein n=1 Tax=Fulvivirga aurantia TaxID=2529383 RepID=UPI0012BB6966|nr:tetratricopeptide repeat protein [Fulvivirga aurantia]MTI19911.1 hypothetical protein [Fulvivirga aurantia]
MNKQKFTQLVKDHDQISAEDRKKLHELVSSYPYSQIIHTLVAKANMDAHTDIAKQTLGYAAMYATDRSVLKDIVTPPVKEKKEPKESATPDKPQTKKVEVKQSDTQAKDTKQEAKSESTSDKPQIKQGTRISFDPQVMQKGEFHMRDQILEDLKALKESKENYLEWVESEESSSNENDKPTEVKVTKPAKKKSSQVPAKKETTVVKKKDATPKKVESKKPATQDDAKAKTDKKTAKKTSSKKKSTKKSKAKSGSTNDQSDIIDRFISKEPSITAKASRRSASNQEDLSQPSTEFTEDLISENLAKIMISQGKTDKAIDIYKKLIWKFPQKKAYFATQIEELKK